MFQKSKRLENRALLDTYHSKRCLACNRRDCDPAHIKTRGSGGDDVWDNVIPLCRIHHTEQGQIGWFDFVEKFPNVGLHLSALGWTFDERRRVIKL